VSMCSIDIIFLESTGFSNFAFEIPGIHSIGVTTHHWLTNFMFNCYF